MRGKKDGGMFCALNQSDGNEPAIELATFLGEWERSNMSDGRLWERNGRREAVRNFGLWGLGTPGVLPSSDCKSDS